MDAFNSAKAENDAALQSIRKFPWVTSSLPLTNAIMGRTANAKTQSVRSEMNRNLYTVFERLFCSRPPPRNTNVMVVSPLTGYLYPLLTRGCRVRWISTGLSVTLSDIRLCQTEYPDAFDFAIKHLGEPATKNDILPGTTTIVVEVNTVHLAQFAATISSPLFRSLLRRVLGGGGSSPSSSSSTSSNRREVDLVVIGRAPLAATLKSLVTSAWVSLAAMDMLGYTIRSRSPDEHNVAALFRVKAGAGLDGVVRDLETLWAACLRRELPRHDCLSGDRSRPMGRVLEMATHYLAEETRRLRGYIRGLSQLPREDWAPLITNASRSAERPYTPAIHSATGRAYGVVHTDLINPVAYESGVGQGRIVCHWGQLKLLVSEMEFFSECRRRGLTRDAVVVYIGSAPGQHINFLTHMFPEVGKWILFDKSTTLVPGSRNVSVRRTFVTDEVIARLCRAEYLVGHKPGKPGKPVLYLNDMRTVTTEAAVASEMKNQARWGVHMRAAAMLLKLRFPYVQDDGSIAPVLDNPARDLAVSPPDASAVRVVARANKGCLTPGLRADAPRRAHHAVWYLVGDVQPQVFAPSISTEARLLVFPAPDGKYLVDQWDVKHFEDCMAGYNANLRFRQDGYSMVPALPVPTLPGLDDGYECARMFSAFADVYGSSSAAAEMGVCIRSLEKATGRTLIDCPETTITKLASAKSHDAPYSEGARMWRSVFRKRLLEHKLFVTQTRGQPAKPRSKTPKQPSQTQTPKPPKYMSKTQTRDRPPAEEPLRESTT